jgi:hypothetical protein
MALFNVWGQEAAQTCLLEGSYGASLVVEDIEDGVELGQLEKVVNLPGQLKQF